MKEITKTYLVYNFDDVEYSDEKFSTIRRIGKETNRTFGETSQTLYTLLYYIQQEDRLDYFRIMKLVEWEA